MLTKGKRGQAVFITVFFSEALFFIMYFMFFGNWMRQSGLDAIALNNLTGVSAFVMANLSFLVALVVIIVGFLTIYFGEGS